MTSRDFCYWLQGALELNGYEGGWNEGQVTMVKQHLAMVFVHEIDPSMGSTEHQQQLTEIHHHHGGAEPTLFKC